MIDATSTPPTWISRRASRSDTLTGFSSPRSARTMSWARLRKTSSRSSHRSVEMDMPTDRGTVASIIACPPLEDDPQAGRRGGRSDGVGTAVRAPAVEPAAVDLGHASAALRSAAVRQCHTLVLSLAQGGVLLLQGLDALHLHGDGEEQFTELAFEHGRHVARHLREIGRAHV